MSDEKSLADVELEQTLGSIRSVGENRDSQETSTDDDQPDTDQSAGAR